MTEGYDLSRRSALLWVTAATAVGAALRFYGLAWGAPYFHFHIDEHIVFTYAESLSRDTKEAAESAKFFMYSPVPMYILNGMTAAYNALVHRLDLTVPRDEVTYMLLGRSISATLGTATIPLVYHVARHVSGRLAGVFAAFLLAFSVIHLRESHFFSLDVSMTFFTVVAWCFLVRTVERGDAVGAAGSALGLGLGVASKYSAAFIGPMIGIAELLSPFGPRGLSPIRPWIRVAVRTALTGLAGVAIFLLLDPLVVRYFDKFQSDIKIWVIDPLSGTSKPEWIAQCSQRSSLPGPYSSHSIPSSSAS